MSTADVVSETASTIHTSVGSTILIVGLFTVASLYLGKLAKLIHLPSLIGYMIMGVIFGNVVSKIEINHVPIGVGFAEQLSFMTDIVLAFVALTIGLELSFNSLKKQGKGIIAVIFTESIMAFVIVTALIFWLTKSLPMALLFGAIAPASAPAGTVAIIHEYKAKGPLTKALYAVVGFDDGLGIIIFGFAAAFSRSLLEQQAGAAVTSMGETLLIPLKEVGLSLLFGTILGIILSFLGRRVKNRSELFILSFAVAVIGVGLSQLLHLSLILTNMIVGMVVANTQPQKFVHSINDGFSHVMPLMYILFFTLAGSNLHLAALPSLGFVGLVYILGRSIGLVSGARLGAILGKMPENIKKYLGMGILSQAGVAIGLSLMVKQDFANVGPVVDGVAVGTTIGITILTTVTATSIVFELIGPILTKIALKKAGEISVNPDLL